MRYSLEITEGKKVHKEQTIKDRVLRKHKRLIRRRKNLESLESSRKKKKLS